MKNKFYYFGCLAFASYISAVIIGGIFYPGYNHLVQAISELTFKQAPNQLLIQPLFWVYNISLLLFSLYLFLWSDHRLVKVTSVLLNLCAISGVLMLLFPQDPINTQLTTAGFIHLVSAGVAALTTLVSVLIISIHYWKTKYKIKYISLLSFLVILIFGPITASAPKLIPAYFGIFERITIGTFMIWLMAFSLHVEGLTSTAKNK